MQYYLMILLYVAENIDVAYVSAVVYMYVDANVNICENVDINVYITASVNIC